MKRIGYLLILLAVAIGLLTRLVAVFQYVTFDIGPDPDQIRDAFAVMGIWQGNFPTLGPSASIGNHYLLPLYYYLFFPFTILGADPAFQALPNALFSFLSIPLFIYLTYLLLENVKSSFRVFLSGLAGLWYSLLFGEIFISNFQWNPSSIPFFLMVFTWLYKLQMESKFSLIGQGILWICYGLTLAILMSLHSSTLFIMPVVFLFSSLIFIFRAKRGNQKIILFLPILSVLSAILALTPYWIGEIDRNFANTKEVLKTILASGSKSANSGLLFSLWSKASNIFLNYFKLIEQVYFLRASWLYLLISIIFLSLITYLGFARFKGNKYVWYIWCSTWLIYLLAASSLDAETAIFFYKLLILFAPIILTIISLAYLDYSRALAKIFAVFIGIIIIFSGWQNAIYDSQFMLSKYGQDRLMNTNDMSQVLSQLPANSTICDPRIKRKRAINNQYNYIDTYITQKNIKVVEICQVGNYVIHPKRLMLIEGNLLNDSNYKDTFFVKSTPTVSTNLWPIFKVEDNLPIARKSKLFLETDTTYVYLLN